MKNYYYQVEFKDGKIIRRENVTKKAAEAAGYTFGYEMLLLNVYSVTWGAM